jgi:hypothetical protein
MAARAQSKVARAVAFLLLSLVAACAAPTTLDPAARFDADSDKAIVVIGGSILWSDDFRDPDQSLSFHWQAFDPKTLRLVTDGASFDAIIRRAVRMTVDDPHPPALVLQVDPGSYALVGAGSGSHKTLYLPIQDRFKNQWGSTWVSDPYIDPMKYIDPEARLAPGSNQMFSVEAGQIVYLGHFAFDRDSRYMAILSGALRFEDEAAARAALAGYPGVVGTLIVVDPSKPPQSASR